MEPPPPKRARSDWGGHESRAAQGREPAYDLSCAEGPTTTRKLVVQLALPDAELRPAVAAWLELRGSLPPPVQRLRYCWTPAKAARHTGGRIDRAVPGLHNFVLQACKPACSSVTASVLNAAAGKEGRDVGMLLAAVEAAGLRDAVSDLILRPFLGQTVRHPQTDDCTEPVLEFLARQLETCVPRFGLVCSNLLSVLGQREPETVAEHPAYEAVLSTLSASADGFLWYDLKPDSRKSLLQAVCLALSAQCSTAVKLQVAAILSKRSYRDKAAKTDEGSRLLRLVLSAVQSGTSLPLPILANTGKAAAAERLGASVARVVGIDLPRGAPLEFHRWLQHLVRDATLPLDDSGTARRVVLDAQRPEGTDNHRFAVSFREFIELARLPVSRLSSDGPCSEAGLTAVLTRRSCMPETPSSLRGTITELGASSDEIICLELGFPRTTAEYVPLAFCLLVHAFSLPTATAAQ